jgi:hypothetical protein
MCACGSDSRHADATRPSANEKAISGDVTSSAASVPCSPESARDLRCQVELLDDLGRRVAALGLAVGEPSSRADHGAVEDRLAPGGHLDGDAETILVGTQRAVVVRELVREHRRHEPGYVGGQGALGRAAVERRTRRYEPRNVGDVHPAPDAVRLSPERQRVVEVLRGLRIDRDRGQIAQVDPPLIRFRRQ